MSLFYKSYCIRIKNEKKCEATKKTLNQKNYTYIYEEIHSELDDIALVCPNQFSQLKRVCDDPQFWLSDPSQSCKFKTVDSIRLDERKTIRCRLHIRQMNGNNNSRSLKKIRTNNTIMVHANWIYSS